MPTRSFVDLMQNHLAQDPAFAEALLGEGIEAMLGGDVETGKTILRDYIKATVGFENLGHATDLPPKRLIRMFRPRGNPQAKHLFSVIGHLQERAGVHLLVTLADRPKRSAGIRKTEPGLSRQTGHAADGTPATIDRKCSMSSSVAFERFIGIDYSGAETPTSRLPGLQVYAAGAGGAEVEKWASPTRSNNRRHVNWTRREIAERLREEAKRGTRFLAGIDHAFSFPAAYFGRYGLKSWPDFLDDFAAHWPTHMDNVYVDFVREGVLHKSGDAPPPGQRVGTSNEFRLTERWSSSAKSVFLFDVNGSVAKSAHAGIPWLRWLRQQVGDRVHIWPFDGWVPPDDKAVIVEVYPSIFRNRYPRGARKGDEQDAFATARWMADMAMRGALACYFQPPLTPGERAVAALEGWIFGVR